MSTFISAIHAASVPVQEISLSGAVQLVLGGAAVLAFILLFKPLLLGIARASLLLVKPKLSKEQRLARRQMRDAQMLSRMLNAMDGSAPSQSAELRALASRS